MKKIIAYLLIASLFTSSCYNTIHVQIKDEKPEKNSCTLEEGCFIEYVVLKDMSVIEFNNIGGLYRKEESVIIGEDNNNTIHIINSSDINYVAIKDFDTLSTVFVSLGGGLLVFTIIGIIVMITSDKRYAPNKVTF